MLIYMRQLSASLCRGMDRVDLSASLASLSVYNQHCRGQTLAYVLRKSDFVIPDRCFEEVARENTRNISEYCLMLNKKQTVDIYVKQFISICDQEGIEEIGFTRIEELQKKYGLENSLSHKVYIFSILANAEVSDYDALQHVYPAKNLTLNYKELEACIDDFVCEAAYLARYKNLEIFLMALASMNLVYKFKSQHSHILDWLEKNVRKYEANPTALLGWECGPCCGPWPSTQVEDYKKTISLLASLAEN